MANANIFKESIPVKDRKRRYEINHNAFSKITPESAYWIGQMLTDGNIFENRINLSCSLKDIDHLKKFKNFLESTHPIEIRYKGEGVMKNQSVIKDGMYARIQIRSNAICYDLKKFGVIPKKSLIAEANFLEKNIDFWRGVVDGDGSICNINRKGVLRPTVSLVGSESILIQFMIFCKNYSPECKAKVLKQKNKNIYQFQITGKSALKIIKALYNRTGIVLKRKHEKAMEIINSYKHEP